MELKLGKNNTMKPSLLKPKDLQHEVDNPNMMSFSPTWIPTT